MDDKNISIIIPYYKGEKTIFKTIDSIIRAMKFSNCNIRKDITVFIDSMEDKQYISKLLKDTYNNQVFIIENEKNLGVARTRNKACSMVNGDYLLFLDQDDELAENYFLIIENEIKNNYDLILTNGFVRNCKNGKLVSIYYKNPKINITKILESNKIITPGQILFCSKLIRESKPFEQCSDEFKGADDWAAYINIFIKNRSINIKYISEKIFYYNLHENNYSNNWEELNNSALKTAQFFKKFVKEEHKKVLDNRIMMLEFENLYRKNKNFKIIMKNLDKFIKYYYFKLKDFNRILSILNKKIIKFD